MASSMSDTQQAMIEALTQIEEVKNATEALTQFENQCVEALKKELIDRKEGVLTCEAHVQLPDDIAPLFIKFFQGDEDTIATIENTIMTIVYLTSPLDNSEVYELSCATDASVRRTTCKVYRGSLQNHNTYLGECNIYLSTGGQTVWNLVT